jgi:hypothetical protein
MFVVGNRIYGALVIITIGFASIYSLRLKDYFFLFFVVNWVVMNIFKPKTRLNHIIWGVFLIFMGGISAIRPPVSGPEKEYLKGVHQSSEFWIGIFIVIVFNIAVGVYTARQRKKGIPRKT